VTACFDFCQQQITNDKQEILFFFFGQQIQQIQQITNVSTNQQTQFLKMRFCFDFSTKTNFQKFCSTEVFVNCNYYFDASLEMSKSNLREKRDQSK
jgi:hypothetical protein